MQELRFKRLIFASFTIFTALDITSTSIDLSLIPKAHELNPLVSWSLPAMFAIKVLLIPVMFFVLFRLSQKEPSTSFEKDLAKFGTCSSLFAIYIFGYFVMHNFYLLGMWLAALI